jgi:hypothetical protein
MKAIGRRLAPEQRFPAALGDVYAEVGIDPGRVATTLAKTGER